MSIEETSGRVFECPSNVDGDVRLILDDQEYEAPFPFRSPPRVLDIGANCGAFALWATKHFPGCTIDAYEPNPEALTFLRKNVQTYDLRTHVHAVGVRGESGRALLRRGIASGKTNICCASFVDVGSQAEDGVDVEVLDAAELPPADVVKVDTEGCELEILRRYLATHAKPVLVLLEAHSRSDRVLLEALLDEAGLELFCGKLRRPNLGTFTFLRREDIPAPLRAH
jgi:FkbM family methyltransferase